MNALENNGEVMPRMLPTVRTDDDEFFIDLRLREFRTKTPPIRPIEFIRFDSEKGQQMLSECRVVVCPRCAQVALASVHSKHVDCGLCGHWARDDNAGSLLVGEPSVERWARRNENERT